MADTTTFHEAGDLRSAYQSVDWDASPVGPPSGWSPALQAAIDVAFATKFAVTLLWGPEYVLLYNQAYVELIADKHPGALGRPAREIFPEAWDTVGPMLDSVWNGAGPTWVEESPLPLTRRGFLEECFFTFSYSPVYGPGGDVVGILDITAETTQQVLARRRLGLLGRVSEELADVRTIGELTARALPLLRAYPDDLPVVDLWLPEIPLRHDGRFPATPPLAIGDEPLTLQETSSGRVAWIPLGAGVDPGQQPTLVVGLSPMLLPDAGYLEFLRLLGSSISQALARVAAHSSERNLSESLQRSLLTSPVVPADLHVAVRYQPAARRAQIGGDWYDSFLPPGGDATLVIGDVSGHDRDAAAAMAQIRNLLRGIAYTEPMSAAAMLRGLDTAMHGLAVDAFATAVVAQVDTASTPDGQRVLRWSNAGHPPPVLLDIDGSARLLDAEPDLLLGLWPEVERSDHSVTLRPGAVVVFYTDGLVERRTAPLDEGLTWLTDTLSGHQATDPDQICDLLLSRLGDTVEDDIAILVVRMGDPSRA